MKALFQIPYRDPPTLANPGKWAPELSDLVTACLKHDPKVKLPLIIFRSAPPPKNCFIILGFTICLPTMFWSSGLIGTKSFWMTTSAPKRRSSIRRRDPKQKNRKGRKRQRKTVRRLLLIGYDIHSLPRKTSMLKIGPKLFAKPSPAEMTQFVKM